VLPAKSSDSGAAFEAPHVSASTAAMNNPRTIVTSPNQPLGRGLRETGSKTALPSLVEEWLPPLPLHGKS
jgi:hypothetical protein